MFDYNIKGDTIIKEEMKLNCQKGNWLDDITLDCPRFGFWIIHVIGYVLLFSLALRFALRRVSLPLIAYRLLRGMIYR